MMKLLVQSDDYGISKAVSLGIIEAVRNGILRNTGIFMNMPYSRECAEWIKPYLNEIALGIDVNVSAGSPLLPARQVPSLVKEDGSFLTSSMHRQLDCEENNFDHIVYNEVFAEFEAQIQEYINVFNKKPDYLQNHAFLTPTKDKAMSDIARKYDIPYCHETVEKYMKCKYSESRVEDWYTSPYTYENQLNSDLKGFILEDRNNLLQREYGFIICHCGYIDKQLIDLSSFTVFRVVDLNTITSDEVKNWVKENNVELITYKELTR